MAWVIDVSVTMAWCFEDERTAKTDALLDRLKTGDTAVVPQLWHLEVANVITQAMRRKSKARITVGERDQFLKMLSAADIQVDSQTITHAWGPILALADAHQLSTYDAAYLELAARLGAELATLDGDLRKAAQAEGVLVIP